MSVLRNLGNGVFAPHATYAVEVGPTSVTAADVDGDGHVDLITANSSGSNTVSVLRNLGNGVFAPQVTYAVGSYPSSVTTADVDGDGHVDLVTANSSSHTVSVLRNQGNGVFAAQVTYAVGNLPRSVSTADVDGDGHVDLVTANLFSDTVSVLRNLGNGVFAPQVTYAVGSDPSSVTAADVDGDGHVDLVTTNQGSHTVSVLRNLGNGGFAPHVTYAAANQPSSVTAADFDGDGHIDLVATNQSSRTVSVLLNLGNGVFDSQVTYIVGDQPTFVTAADIDGDGHVDLVTANRSGGRVSVLLNLGNGVFAAQSAYAVGSTPISVTAADIDGDGHVDLVTANQGSNTVSVLLNLGNGGFAGQSTLAVGSIPTSVTTADVDGDGHVDLITSNQDSHTLSVLRNLGNGSFAAQVTYAVGNQPSSVTAADVDGDGHIDLVTANRNSSTVSVLRNLGNGGFSPQATYAVGSNPSSVTAADVDGDGHVDLVTANRLSTSVSVLRNLGNGGFAPQVNYWVGLSPSSVTAADVDGDGHIDLVTANRSSSTVSVLRNQGNGVFAAQVTYAVGNVPLSVTTADVDGDAHVDLITSNQDSHTLSVLRNLGNGSFAAQVTYAVGNQPSSVTTADINGDGLVDLVTTTSSSNIVSVLLNLGMGTGASTGADLSVATISAQPNPVDLGTKVSVEYTVRNDGVEDAPGRWVDTVYLSADNQWDVSDVVLTRIIREGGLAAGTGYTQQVSVPVPPVAGIGPREWFVLVRTDSGGGLAEPDEANNTVAVPLTIELDIQPLLLGELTTGTMSTGEARYYRLDLSAGSPLQFYFDGERDADRFEIYLRHNELPTRGRFDYRYEKAGADHQIVIPFAAPGSWYVLVYAHSAPTPSDFGLRADAYPLFLAGVSPDSYAGNQVADLTVSGGGFLPGTQVHLVGSGGSLHAADSTQVNSVTRLAARFDLATFAAGSYGVRVSLPDGTSETLPSAFQVLLPGEANLETKLILPSALGRHATATIHVEYANTGTVAMPAPILILQSGDPDESDKPLLTLDQSRLVAGFWTSALPDGFAQAVQIYASGATPGLLLPGERIRVPVYYAGLLQNESHGWDFSDNHVELEVRIHEAGNPEPIDWNALKPELQPSWIAAEAWDTVFVNLTADMPTWGDYVQVLSDNAVYLGRFGHKVTDVNQLYVFELQQSLGLNPVSTLAGALDISLVSPGLPLAFGRSFGNTILERYTAGPFGQGWTSTWQQLHIEELADGTVVLHSGSGQIRFQPDRRAAGKYFVPQGFTGTFRKVTGGAFELTAANGGVTRFHAGGLLDYVEDTSGNRITSGYTAGRLTGLAHSSGASLAIAYNAAGLIAGVSDSIGTVNTYTYDATNTYLLSATRPEGTVAYTYDTGANPASKHALTSITGPDGVTRHFEYDARGRLVATFLSGDVERVEYTYDETGIVTSTDAAGVSATLYYDHFGRVARSEDAMGNYLLYEYNAAGQVIRQTDSLGQTQLFNWSSSGALTSVTDTLGNVTRFSAGGPHNQPTAFIDANGNRTQYAYDSDGNLTGTTYADGSVEQVAYDALGNPTQLVNRRSQAIGFEYNSLGQLTKETFPDGSTNAYAYEARNRLASSTDSHGTTTFDYDAADRLRRVDYPNGRWLEYTYDAAGRRIRMEDHSGYAVGYHYDAVGRLAGLTDAGNASIVAYTYDLAGRLSREDKGNDSYTIHTYDSAGRVAGVVHYAPDGSINFRFDYAYDTLGRRTGMTTLDGQWAYTYDATGQLIRAVFASENPEIDDQDLRYFYDALGNRTRTLINGVTTDYTANNLNQYTTVGDTTYQYDLDGNLVLEVSPEGTRAYTYNARSQLVRLETPDGVWEYEYDAFGNRIATVFDGERTEYLLDMTGFGDVIGEYDGDGNRAASYIHGLGLEATNRTGGWAFYDFDAIGSTAGITGMEGDLLNSYAYDPFGAALWMSETIFNPFQFVGEFGVVAESNSTHFMRARYYDSTSGRFLSSDPIGLASGDVNLYRYVSNSPTQFIDPEGTILWIPAVLAAVRVASIAYSFYSAWEAGEDVAKAVSDPTGRNVAKATVGVLTTVLSPVVKLASPLSWLGDKVGRIYGPLDRGIPLGWKQNAHNLVKGEILGEFGGLIGGEIEGHIVDVIFDDIWTESRQGAKLGPGSWGSTPLPQHNGQSGSVNSTSAAQSVDPNEKFGAAGHGLQAFITADTLIPYVVHFENLGPGSIPAPTTPATAPAQRVEVTDQLSAHLDWDTLQFTEFGFGDNRFVIPDGRQYHYATVAMTYNDQTFDVEVELDFDLSSGMVRVVFQSIDPETFLPPDVLTGFLPPEDGTGIGKGYFSFTIMPEADLTTGTELRNVAYIIFDGQEVIATNQINPQDVGEGIDPNKEALNTIDSGLPTSTVETLPVVQPLNFPVTWAGTDDAGGSGVAAYDVYVSVDGGLYSTWLSGTNLTSSTYSGVNGRSYSFISVAIDNVGNRQVQSAIAHASTVALLHPWQNPINPLDVNMSGNMTAFDAIELVNWLNDHPLPERLPQPTLLFQPKPFLDVDGDDYVTALDALIVINWLNLYPLGEPTPESAGEFTQSVEESLDQTASLRFLYEQVASIPSSAKTKPSVNFRALQDVQLLLQIWSSSQTGSRFSRETLGARRLAERDFAARLDDSLLELIATSQLGWLDNENR